MHLPFCKSMGPNLLQKTLLKHWRYEWNKLTVSQMFESIQDIFSIGYAMTPQDCIADGVLAFFLDKSSLFVPASEHLYNVLMPELWSSMETENFDLADSCFPGMSNDRLVQMALENECKRHAQEIQKQEAWLVSATRETHPAFANLELIDWNDRFGVFRIAPLAFWNSNAVKQFYDQHEVPCDSLGFSEEQILLSNPPVPSIEEKEGWMDDDGLSCVWFDTVG